MSSSPKAAGWFSPANLLRLFICLALLIYLDRGAIASNGVNGTRALPDGTGGRGIQGDFSLTLFQDGLLPAAFMVGLLVSSPIFAEAAKHSNAFRLIGVGLAIWVVAIFGCGVSLGFTSLLLCRMLVGVGEASFVALASPFIDDNAPAGQKTRWLASFYMCIPVGFAIGYIFGGTMGQLVGWRAVFLIQAAVMTPFAIFCLRAPAIDLRGTHEAGAVADAEEAALHHHHTTKIVAKLEETWRDIKQLTTRPVYIFTVLGMTLYTAVLGCFAFYAPQAGKAVFNVHPQTADITFGAVTVVTGIFGTLSGGFILDKIGSSLGNAMRLCAVVVAIGGVFSVCAFALTESFASFVAVFAVGEFFMFMSQAPSNALAMWSVPSGLRPFAVSLMVVTIHILGDVPSPPLLGLFQEHVDNWRLSMALLSMLLFVASFMYTVGYFATLSAIDYRTVVVGGSVGDNRDQLDEEFGGLRSVNNGDEVSSGIGGGDGGGRAVSPLQPLLAVGTGGRSSSSDIVT